MSFIQEFKKFALKGNVVDLAIGVVIGAAFGSIVESLIKDVAIVVFLPRKICLKLYVSINKCTALTIVLFGQPIDDSLL